MSEETKAPEAVEQVQAQQEEAQKPDETDWKAKYEAMREHSREWEKKAKGNQSAADELEKLKAEQMTEQEKALKRAEEAEAELAEMKAKAARAESVAKIAADNALPVELVSMLSGADDEELAAQVARLKKLTPAYPTRTDDGGANATVAKKEIPIIF